MQKFVWLLLSVLLKRHRLFLFAPLIYISRMLLYMGSVSFDAGEVGRHHLVPGSVYRSPKVFENLWPALQIDNETHNTRPTFGAMMVSGQKAAHLALKALGLPNALDGSLNVQPELTLAFVEDENTATA